MRALAAGVLWAMLGPKTVLMIALVVLAFYGRGGSRLLRMTRYGRALDPWLNLARPTPTPTSRPQADAPVPPPPARAGQGRLFWALALTAAAAVAAWVATRALVVAGSGWSR